VECSNLKVGDGSIWCTRSLDAPYPLCACSYRILFACVMVILKRRCYRSVAVFAVAGASQVGEQCEDVRLAIQRSGLDLEGSKDVGHARRH
jgi:hypothetical protein